MTCKTQSGSQESTEEQVPFEQLWRSRSTVSSLLLFSTLPCSTSTPTHLLLYRYDVAVSMPSSTLYAPLLCPTIFYSSLRFSTLLCYALLFSTLHSFILPLLYLYPPLLTTLPPLYVYSTSTLPLLYYLHSTSTQVPTGHNDLWASENVTS